MSTTRTGHRCLEFCLLCELSEGRLIGCEVHVSRDWRIAGRIGVDITLDWLIDCWFEFHGQACQGAVKYGLDDEGGHDH